MPNVLYFCPHGVGRLLDKCPRGQKLRNVPIDINILAISWHGRNFHLQYLEETYTGIPQFPQFRFPRFSI